MFGWFIIYIHFRRLLLCNGILPGIKFTVPPSLTLSYMAALLHGTRVVGVSQTLRRWAEGARTGSRSHPIRAASWGGGNPRLQNTFRWFSQNRLSTFRWFSQNRLSSTVLCWWHTLQKPAPETGVRNWRRFLASVSGACVRGITPEEPINEHSVTTTLKRL